MISSRRMPTFVALATLAAAPAVASTTIDFETPSVVGQSIINPYVSEGVTFTALPFLGFDDAVVGLAWNSSTSACVDPADNNQKLGTGRLGGIGVSGFPIKAVFPLDPAPAVTMVSVEFQTVATTTVRLRLFNASGAELAATSDQALPGIGTCGFPGEPRGKRTLSAMAAERVAYAIMDDLFNSALGGYTVFVLDSFTFGGSSTAARTMTWGRLRTLYR